jgi:hypothetical protein
MDSHSKSSETIPTNNYCSRTYYELFNESNYNYKMLSWIDLKQDCMKCLKNPNALIIFKNMRKETIIRDLNHKRNVSMFPYWFQDIFCHFSRFKAYNEIIKVDKIDKAEDLIDYNLYKTQNSLMFRIRKWFN